MSARGGPMCPREAARAGARIKAAYATHRFRGTSPGRIVQQLLRPPPEQLWAQRLARRYGLA